MIEDRQILQHLKSNELEQDGSIHSPSPENIEYGEIAINYKKDHETILIKNDNDEIVKLSFNNGVGLKPFYAPTFFTGESEERPFHDKNEIYDYIRYCNENKLKLYEKEKEEEARIVICEENNMLFVNNIVEYSSLIDDRPTDKPSKKINQFPKKCVVRKHLPLNPNYMINYFFNGYPIMDIGSGSYVFMFNRIHFDTVEINGVGYGGVDGTHYTMEEWRDGDIKYIRIVTDCLCQAILKTRGYKKFCVIRNEEGNYAVSYEQEGETYINLDALRFVDPSNVEYDTFSPYIKLTNDKKLVCVKDSFVTRFKYPVNRKIEHETTFHINNLTERAEIRNILKSQKKRNAEIYYHYNKNNKAWNWASNRTYIYVVKNKDSISLYNESDSIAFIGDIHFVFQHPMFGHADVNVRDVIIEPRGYYEIDAETIYENFGSGNGYTIELFPFIKLLSSDFSYRDEDNPEVSYTFISGDRMRFDNTDRNKWKKLKNPIHGIRWPSVHYHFTPLIYKFKNGGNTLVANRNKCTFKFVRKYRGVRCKPVYLRVIKRRKIND